MTAAAAAIDCGSSTTVELVLLALRVRAVDDEKSELDLSYSSADVHAG